MNFVHPLRSPRAPAEGSMERSHFVWLLSISRGGPLRRLHRLPPWERCGGSETTKRRGGEAHIPCPHFNITIIARGKVKGSSVIGAAAYQSGDKIYSEYEHEWKSGDHLERIIHTGNGKKHRRDCYPLGRKKARNINVSRTSHRGRTTQWSSCPKSYIKNRRNIQP